ncbi:hypothetical protein H8356DRAFT_1022276 [Neocallimastix lanati (nom. inval.)]|uniref:SH3 domain-containing protein n=1 Tax=Neocallimastix californiae TaxID=1754190 RepID=A0A1Y2DVT7_9FUNG|nr:hypothetical protein H8356DRAFT_1022276 [Neocallimastix sp. JGI-2020a]ORY62755.1 hypothetical protein LY90DRAFT_700989 [Neocallimastix californiae]|eukprot:ORY62755.1 hypothetical protein LY90DRAFT_700989 [Neocallimastix californiae]
MRIKTIIFFFMLILVVLAQTDKDEDPEQVDKKTTKNSGENPKTTTEAQTEVKQDKTTKAQQPTTEAVKKTTSAAKQTVNPNPVVVTSSVIPQTTTTTTVQTTVAQPTSVVQPTSAPLPSSSTAAIPTNVDNGVVAALFIIGIVFNFINKRKQADTDPINEITYGTNNQAADPAMTTSMFNGQNDVYGQTMGYGGDYYSQYGTGADQYNQAVADPYGQGYQNNYTQRTLSLNRNPSSNNQNYQSEQNARDVIYNHRPEAADEIELRRGDRATIYEKYEDGWAWGYNFTTGKTGMFPQQCLAA